ncbi:three-Cys-motif partner protein TcmP [Nocardia arthritidis]|uniref:Three-Cys-motif partner protein TcmP n=1 Tax=Nocardia arthritidis TaxID=228602 RepID=A0A6G9YKN9_9NOCA|nr:three-Cys-motif partner protein TcmP [Nocardia arthritidis]QIS13637.1 three-Cys-motif partner protein TcmP [Nocardia arthritidis]
MSAKNPVPWPIEPHTVAKHALYRQYFSKWFPIMANGWNGNVTYAEGFAGPGIYTGGEPGSPVIALRTIFDNPETWNKNMRLLFVDHDKRCTDLLPKQLENAAGMRLGEIGTYGIDLEIREGSCVPVLEQLLDEHHAWGRPMLVVLDTWGGAVPFDLVHRIAGNRGGEVLITMQPQFFSRFAENEENPHGDAVFGDTGWRAVHQQPSGQKAGWLLRRYRDTIRKAGFGYVLDFELVDRRGQSLFLVFGTDHPKGLKKMKEAMWEVDDVSGIGYRDPRDPGQQTLAIVLEPNIEPLKRLLLLELRKQEPDYVSVLDLRRFALYRTVFKESQVIPALDSLIDKRLVETSEPARRKTISAVRIRQPS